MLQKSDDTTDVEGENFNRLQQVISHKNTKNFNIFVAHSEYRHLMGSGPVMQYFFVFAC